MFALESLRPRLDAAAESARAGGLVDLAILGQFKAGKSSLLNALLGQDVLPVGVLPATAVVTRLGYGPQPRATVRRLSGESFDVPLSRLAEFVTEQENPENAKEVALVDVELPALHTPACASSTRRGSAAPLSTTLGFRFTGSPMWGGRSWP